MEGCRLCGTKRSDQASPLHVYVTLLLSVRVRYKLDLCSYGKQRLHTPVTAGLSKRDSMLALLGTYHETQVAAERFVQLLSF